MVEGTITAVLVLLAVAGAAALGERLFRAIVRVLLTTAETAAASGIAESSARRGDLTRMQEGAQVARKARAARLQSALLAVVWLLWLAVPLALELLPAGYAAAAPLWLFRDRRLLRSGEEG